VVNLDRLTKEQRRKNMQAIKNKDSKIEILLRKELWKRGIRYRKNYAKLPGKPDIVLTKYKIAIFADSEFWHGYDWENRKNDIKSNRDLWIRKIEGNIKRDKEVTEQLEKEGWIVLRFWGKQIQKDLQGCINIIEETIKEVKANEKILRNKKINNCQIGRRNEPQTCRYNSLHTDLWS